MLRTATSRVGKSLLALSLCAGMGGGAVLARTLSVPAVATVTLSKLPSQGQQTYHLIRQGGPFQYEKDGMVFGNRERQLPLMRRGYYREYTVETEGARDRGARRIVCGGKVQTRPDACYYTNDHYSSFRKIIER